MRNYELTYLIPASLTEEEQKRISEDIASFIQEKGGVLKEGGIPIKRMLPQKIKQHGEVFSVSMYFYANPDKLQEIREKLGAEKNIIRFMITIKETPPAPKPVRKKTKEEPQKKVDLKDIENKIEEILKEE